MKIAIILLIIVTTFFVFRSIYNKNAIENVGFEKMVMPGLISNYHANYRKRLS